MCGICFWLQWNHATQYKSYYEQIIEFVARRGPDYHGQQVVCINNTEKILNFHGCVLHLRGEKLAQQPAFDAYGNALLWNGEIFAGLQVEETESDTVTLLKQLQANETMDENVLNTFSKIKGPYAFIYYQAASNLVWFGRDVFGRRSLLIHFPINENDYFSLSSVAPKRDQYDWFEVPALGIFCLDLNKLNVTDGVASPEEYCRWIQLYRWYNPYRFNQQLNSKDPPNHWYTINDCVDIQNGFISFNRLLPSNNCIESEFNQNAVVDKLCLVLSESVKKRIYCITSPSCFLSLSNSDDEQNHKDIPKAKVAILYSGGIDSAILAALADRHVPSDESIDLINVAFAPVGDLSDNKYEVPDRISGRDVLEELRKVNVKRCWNFIEVNISKEELQEARKNHVKHLVHPHRTVLDDSIGCAIWFASRGRGLIKDSRNGSFSTYCSSAKVLLVGMGADEQLAGYTRHRKRFTRDGWEGLLKEIEMEISRISTRNLGRDDRCIGDHCREARFPYLDEDVVSFLNGLPIWNKADLRLPKGVGDKLLLRKVGQSLGLFRSSKLEKKAIQFGSRIAKLEKSSEKGSEQCSRLD